jgi:hypothetical protein
MNGESRWLVTYEPFGMSKVSSSIVTLRQGFVVLSTNIGN